MTPISYRIQPQPIRASRWPRNQTGSSRRLWQCVITALPCSTRIRVATAMTKHRRRRAHSPKFRPSRLVAQDDPSSPAHRDHPTTRWPARTAPLRRLRGSTGPGPARHAKTKAGTDFLPSYRLETFAGLPAVPEMPIRRPLGPPHQFTVSEAAVRQQMELSPCQIVPLQRVWSVNQGACFLAA